MLGQPMATLIAWADKLQGLRQQLDLDSYTEAKPEKQSYVPFASVVNTILGNCRLLLQDDDLPLPPFPVDDMRFYKADIKLEGERKGQPDREPDVVALRSGRLSEREVDEIESSDHVGWSDVLLAVEIKLLKGSVGKIAMVSLMFYAHRAGC